MPSQKRHLRRHRLFHRIGYDLRWNISHSISATQTSMLSSRQCIAKKRSEMWLDVDIACYHKSKVNGDNGYDLNNSKFNGNNRTKAAHNLNKIKCRRTFRAFDALNAKQHQPRVLGRRTIDVDRCVYRIFKSNDIFYTIHFILCHPFGAASLTQSLCILPTQYILSSGHAQLSKKHQINSPIFPTIAINIFFFCFLNLKNAENTFAISIFNAKIYGHYS